MLERLASLVVLLLVGPLLLIGVVGLLFLSAAIIPSSLRRVRETFWCPWKRRVVTADFLVPERAAYPLGVASCTGFPDPKRITCQKACRELAEVRWGLSRGVFPRWALISGGVTTWRTAAESAREK